MGDWSITMALSICSIPSMASCRPGVASALCIVLSSAGASVSVTSEDLPLPETPVTPIMQPSGNAASMSWRLFCLTDLKVSHLSSGVLRSPGTGIDFLPER